MAESRPAQSLNNRLETVFQAGSRLLRRWSLGPKAKDQIESWQELDSTAASLEDLMSREGWGIVEKIASFYKKKAELAMRMPDLSESQRLRAAIEWNMLETLFRDIRERVYQGQRARKSLSKVQIKV